MTTERTPDLAARHAFLDALYELTPLAEQFVVSRFQPNATLVGGIGDWEEMSTRIDAKPRCTYFGVASRSELFVSEKGSRGSTAEIGHLPALYLDLDVDDEGGHKNARGNFATMQDAYDFLDAIKIKPSAVVSSGHGLQAYWFLARPLAQGDAVKATAEFHDLQPRIQFKLYGATGKDAPGPDPAVCGDPCRVLRLPETPNLKVDGDPRWCEVVTANYAQRYSVEAVLAAFRASGEDPVTKKALPTTVPGTAPVATKFTAQHPPSLMEFLNGLGRELHPDARAYLEAEVQDRRDRIRDALVDKLDWEVVGEFDDEYGTGYHLLRPGGSSAQSATIGGCVDEKTDWSTGETLGERCISDAMIVWSSAAEPFASQPEAARTTYPTFDGLRILKLLGVIPEDIPIIAHFDRTTGEHTYDIDHHAVESWKPSTAPRVLMPRTADFESVDPEAPAEAFDHGEHGSLSVDMFPPAVVAEAKRRCLDAEFLSPSSAILQVYAEAVVACSGADVVTVKSDGTPEYASSMNAFILTLGNPGTGKDAIVSNLDSDYISELLDEYTPFFPKPSFPPIPTVESAMDGDPREVTPEEQAKIDRAVDLDKKMRKTLYPRHGSIVQAAKSPEGISTASSKTPIMVIASSEGADIKVAFGLRFKGDIPSSVANDHYDVKGGRKIGGAQQQGRDDRFSANASLTIVGAVQPSVGADLLTPVACQEIGLTHRFDIYPLRELVHGFDDVKPLRVGLWRRYIGLLISGFYNHALCSAKLEQNEDGSLRVQRWGRTQVTATAAVRSLYNSSVSRTINNNDSDDLAVTLRAKRARKALAASGIFASLEAVEQWHDQMKLVPRETGIVEFTRGSDLFMPIEPGSPCFVAGATEKPVTFKAPKARWQVEREHFLTAWKLSEVVERYTLEEIIKLEEHAVASATKVATIEDVVKTRSAERSQARERGEKLALDSVLRAAYEASQPLIDEEGWFPANSGSGPRALRKLVRTLANLSLEDSNEVIERRVLPRGRILWRWKVSLA